MAQVSFNNAIIEPARGKPLTEGELALIYNNGAFYKDISDLTVRANSNSTASILNQTNTKISVIYSGTFVDAGTCFYFGNTTTGMGALWKVSNINFSAGDTYSFVVDVEISIGG